MNIENLTIEQLEAMAYRLVKAQSQINHDLQVIEHRISQLKEKGKVEVNPDSVTEIPQN